MNTQRKEDIIKKDKLEVNELFYSLQGEGPFVGMPAVFVRLAGCNLSCPACDTLYTTRTEMSPQDVFEEIIKLSDNKKKTKLVVFTGGEPLRQAACLQGLMMILKGAGFALQIETNGSIFPRHFPFPLAVVVCSPKGRIHKDIDPRIDIFKYVLSADRVDQNDGLPLDSLDNDDRPSRPLHGQPIYVQPMDSGRHLEGTLEYQTNQQAAVDSCLKYGYRLCLQIHKLIGVK